MKLYTTIFSLLVGSTALFAQKSIDKNAISITTAPLHCNVPSEGYEADLIALTITNNSNEVKTVSYSFELYYDDNCATCGHEEYLYTQTLQPLQTLKGICLDRNNMGLTIFDHMPAHLTKTKLTDFNIKNVTVQ
ncbi:MAG: hypothetical protein ACKOWX_01880 [Flavobacteriales bacterium]